jgi:peptidoglycan/xylan/chitin deacetylase (PgdA/CDA1 family)
MLNAFNARIGFVVVFMAIMVLNIFYPIPRMVYPVLLLAYILLVFWGSYFIQSDFFVKAHYKGDKNRKAIAITFDDGPMQEFTPRLLDLLKTEKVSAGFFLIGRNVEASPTLAKRIVDEGHLVGNHSYSHTYWFSMNSAKSILADLKQSDEQLVKATGLKPRFFRPPYGVTNPMVAKAVKEGGYDCIGWNIRTYDTNATSAEQLLQKSLKNLSNGDIILFHDWGKHTIGILSDFIAEVRKRGFEIVRLDELLGAKAYY